MFRSYCKTPAYLGALALVSALLAGGARAEDKLFSEKPPGKVFAPEADSPGSGNGSTSPQRMQTIAQLMDVLRDMGLGPVAEGEKETTIKLQHSKWTFSYVLGLSEGSEQVNVILLLGDASTLKGLDSGRLLALLNVNSKVRPAVFSFSDSRQRVELLLGVPNSEITPKRLREAIDFLAKTAENTSSIWDVPPPAATPPATEPAKTQSPAAANNTANNAAKPPTQQQAPPPANQAQGAQPQAGQRPAANVVGKWSASKSQNEAFAMALNGDGSFTLVYVKDKKQSKSTGKFTLTSGQLTLTTSEGGKFTGGITNLTAKSFDFQPQGTGATKLTFQKAS